MLTKEKYMIELIVKEKLEKEVKNVLFLEKVYNFFYYLIFISALCFFQEKYIYIFEVLFFVSIFICSFIYQFLKTKKQFIFKDESLYIENQHLVIINDLKEETLPKYIKKINK